MDMANATLGTGVTNGLASFGTGIINTILNKQNVDRNFAFQKHVFNYQKQLQREIFQREDNAIRRRASDIAAAGGNPAMAWETNTGAAAGQNIPVSTPQSESFQIDPLVNSSLSQITGAMQQFQQFQLNDAIIKNTDAQASKTKAETITESIRQKQIEMMTAKTEEEKERIKLEIEALDYDLNYSINHDLRTHDPINTVYNAGKDMVNNLSSLIPNNLDELDDNNLLSLAADIGLTIIPGLATLKFASLGGKAIKSALKFLKSRNGINSTADFYVTYKKLTGRAPSSKEVELFKEGVTQKVPFSGNKYPKSYYYRKYGK